MGRITETANKMIADNEASFGNRVVAGICAYQNMISWDSMGALHQ